MLCNTSASLLTCLPVCVCVAKQLVERVIRKVHPQVVMVEVDAYRIRLLPPGEALKVPIQYRRRLCPIRCLSANEL